MENDHKGRFKTNSSKIDTGSVCYRWRAAESLNSSIETSPQTFFSVHTSVTLSEAEDYGDKRNFNVIRTTFTIKIHVVKYSSKAHYTSQENASEEGGQSN